jgi:hypothetical protein
MKKWKKLFKRIGKSIGSKSLIKLWDKVADSRQLSYNDKIHLLTKVTNANIAYCFGRLVIVILITLIAAYWFILHSGGILLTP